MKRILLCCFFVATHHLLEAQVSKVERLSSVVYNVHPYFNSILSVFDSIQYSYPDVYNGGGLEQTFCTPEIGLTKANSFQEFVKQDSRGYLSDRSKTIKRNPWLHQITLSTVDYYDHSGNYILGYLSDSVMEFNDKGLLQLISIKTFPDSISHGFNFISYTYNNLDILESDTLHQLYADPSNIKTISYQTYEYNDQQRLKVYKKISSNKSVLNHIEYTYDELGRIILLDNKGNNIKKVYSFSADGSIDTLTIINSDSTRQITTRLSDKTVTMFFKKNNVKEWYVYYVKKAFLNEQGLDTLVREESLNETRLTNGQFWYINKETRFRYNDFGHVISTEYKDYLRAYDTLITSQKINPDFAIEFFLPKSRILRYGA